MKKQNGTFIQALLCAFLIVCFLALQNVKSNRSVKAGAFGDDYDTTSNYTFSHLAERLTEKF